MDKTRPYYNTPGLLQANVDAIVEAYGALAEQGVAAEDARLVLVTHSIPWAWRPAPPRGRAPRVPAGASGVPCTSSVSGPAEAGRREPGVAADLSTEVSYVAQHEALVAVLVPEVARRLGLETVEADLVYCSRSGPPQARWLEPDVNDHLEALAAGHLTDGRPVDRPGGVVVAPFGFISDHMEVVFDSTPRPPRPPATWGCRMCAPPLSAPTRPLSTPSSTSSSSGPPSPAVRTSTPPRPPASAPSTPSVRPPAAAPAPATPVTTGPTMRPASTPPGTNRP